MLWPAQVFQKNSKYSACQGRTGASRQGCPDQPVQVSLDLIGSGHLLASSGITAELAEPGSVAGQGRWRPVSARRRFPRWPLGLMAAPAAAAVWSGWVGLGQLCGFGVVQPLPGIWDSLTINSSVTLPVGVESYGAYVLGAWLTPGTRHGLR
jgi:hypothetical protein